MCRGSIGTRHDVQVGLHLQDKRQAASFTPQQDTWCVSFARCKCQLKAAALTTHNSPNQNLLNKPTHLVRLLHSLQVVCREVGGGGGCRLCGQRAEGSRPFVGRNLVQQRAELPGKLCKQV